MATVIGRKRWNWLLAVVLLLAAVLAPALPAMAAPDATFDLKFSGVINAVPAAAGESWFVAGYELAADSATQIRLTVGPAVAGMWADVTADRLPDGSLLLTHIVVKAPEVRLKGPLTAKPEGGIGAWTVAGQTVLVTADTIFSLRTAPIVVGQWVEVHAIEAPAGVLTAVRMRGIEATEYAEVYGAIQSVSASQWLLSSIPVAATDGAIILGEPATGLLAHAACNLTEDGQLSARVFRVDWQEPTGRLQPVAFSGIVQTLPADGLIGLWMVNGQATIVQDATQIFQAKGLVQVGAHVHVEGYRGAEAVVATSITVLTSPSGGGQMFHLWGNIEAMPQTGLLGTWTIAGVQVQVTRQSRIYGASQARLGAPAEAGGMQLRDGVRVLTWMRLREQTGAGPQPSVTPTPRGTGTPQATATPHATHTPVRTPTKGR